jgi:hypothetical protein
MSLKLYRPVPGGLEPAPVEQKNWRRRLRSRKWDVPELRNPEIGSIRPRAGVLFFGALGLLTFVLLIVGRSIGYWTLPAA